MISSEDVRRVTFDKAMRGYRCDDVDDYLKQVAESMDALAAKNDEMQKNLVVLAQRIDQYRAEEDTLRTTMINAQRLGENVIREAKQKAAEIIRTANMKADDREQRARDDVELAKQEIVTLKSEADSFKRSLMEMYRKHINLISKMPEYNPPAPAEEPQPAAQPASAAQSYAEPAPEAVPYTEPAPAPAPVQEPESQATSYYNPAETAPAPEPTPVAEPAPEKVDTVEFAIAPHPEEPEETAPVAEPAADDRFQPGAGLYDDAAEAAPAPAKRGTRKAPAKRGTRKKASTEPQEELNSPAFDNFEGVDFDS